MTDSELKKYHVVITDSWQLLKKYSSPSSDNEFWEQLVNEAGTLYYKHGQTSFSLNILTTVIKEIEEIYKKAEQDTKPIKQVSMFTNQRISREREA